MKLGIVGLPNVGKSTLFNAITNAGERAPITPSALDQNVGMVTVPDEGWTFWLIRRAEEIHSYGS